MTEQTTPTPADNEWGPWEGKAAEVTLTGPDGSASARDDAV
ncbi:MAG TPA: hypothetical protein VGR22_00575 [Thermomicrobiales bacterium]|nr:hypothetical protein [Thermomicrobiales bacterium]